jgi:superfamily II DNA helicase RecQ
MKFQFFVIPAHSSEAGQQELNGFCAGHRLATVEKQFVANGDSSFWAVCVTYLEGDEKQALPPKSKIDYREVLNEKDFAVFAKLRALRKTLAEKEGIPAYALFTNEQLAAMAQTQAKTLAALSAIDGVGKARLDKYGNLFLDILYSSVYVITAHADSREWRRKQLALYNAPDC